MAYPQDDKLTAQQAAELFGMSASTFYGFRRHNSDFPQPAHLIGRRHAWALADVLAWFDAHDTGYKPKADPFAAIRAAAEAEAATHA